jgi:Tol biopolymer transport system component
MKRLMFAFAFAAVPVFGLVLTAASSAPPSVRTSPSPADAGSSFEALLFAPGTVSTSMDELGAALSPDGSTFFFARRSPTTSSSPVQAIFFTRLENGKWSRPEIAPFSGTWPDFAPAFSPDGKALFFTSLRPRDGGSAVRADADIWRVEQTVDGWGEPRMVPAPIASDQNDAFPSLAADGTLYFASDRPGGAGSVDIWRAAKTADGYAAPEVLPAAIDTPAYESQPAISPDQRVLVFVSVGRPEIPMTGGSVYPRPDLYASERIGGVWRPARRLGPAVNTTASETAHSLSPDAKRLFFTSDRGFTAIPMAPGLTRAGFEERIRGIDNGRGNIYEIPIERLGLTGNGGRP